MAEADQFWDRKRKSPYRWIASLVHVSLVLGGILLMLFRGPHVPNLHGPAVLYLFDIGLVVGLLIVVTVHEFGHTAVAWAVGFKFHALNIGPLTVTKDRYGHSNVRFDWNRLIGHGGYAAAVPVSEEHIRFNAIMMVFAGPFASLNAGLLCFFLYLRLQGTSIEAFWPIPGLLAILFIADFVGNLIPAGYCDGTMLLHLLLWTRHGQDLYAIHLAAKTHEDATQRLVEQDFAGEVKLRRKALEQLLARGDSPTLQLGHSYQALGFALLNHSQREEAVASFQKSIEIFARCHEINPIHEANSWKGLAHLYRVNQSPDEAQPAIDAALMAFDKAKDAITDRTSAASVLAAMAQLHADARHYELGRRDIEEALTLLPDGHKHLVHKADFLRLRVRCEGGLGNIALAKKDAADAAQILRSPEIPEAERSHAASAMGTLAATMWMAGVGDSPEVLAESIQALEQKGPSSRAVGLRMMQASVLRRVGRLADAEAALPPEADVEPERRKTLLTERAEIFAETNRVMQAIEDAREVLKLAQQQEDHAVEAALAEAKLSEFLLQAGKAAEAEDFARRACDVLVPRQHPGASGALVTLALIRNDETAGPFIEHAIELVKTSRSMEAGSKARELERIERRTRLQKSGNHDNLYRQEDLCLPQS